MYDPAILAILEIINMITKLIIKKNQNFRFKQKAYSLMVSFKIYFKGPCNSLSSMFWDYYIWITARDFGTYCIFANPSNTRMLCDFFYLYPGHPFFV